MTDWRRDPLQALSAFVSKPWEYVCLHHLVFSSLSQNQLQSMNINEHSCKSEEIHEYRGESVNIDEHPWGGAGWTTLEAVSTTFEE